MARKSSTRNAKSVRRAGKPVRPLRAKRPDAFGIVVTAASQLLALPIEPSWHTGVTFNLQLLFKHAARIDEFSLPDDIEPASVFRA
jgi:1-carboxybiuret hydrolase subunit AtzG-like